MANGVRPVVPMDVRCTFRVRGPCVVLNTVSVSLCDLNQYIQHFSLHRLAVLHAEERAFDAER
jgi:hypothetical protein